MGQVLEQNLSHELDLVVPRQAQHVRRQVPLQRAENGRTEIQLQVVVALGLVLLVRVQPQPLVRHGHACCGPDRIPGDNAVPASGEDVPRRRRLTFPAVTGAAVERHWLKSEARIENLNRR